MSIFSRERLSLSGRRPAIAVAAIVVLAVLIRAPFSGNAGSDEAYYLVIGRQWLHGLPPYAGSYDVKPPLLFLLMAAAEAVFGPSLWAAKALTAACVAITASGLYLLGRRFSGELSGLAAAALYILASLTLGGTFSPAELLMAPFTTLGMVTGLLALTSAIRARSLALLASGLLFGAAACIKQTALFEAAAFGAVMVSARSSVGRLRGLTVFAAGGLIVPLTFAVYYAAIGHWSDLAEKTVLLAAGRANSAYVPPWDEACVRLFYWTVLILPVVMMASAFWVHRGIMRERVRNPLIPLLAGWSVGSLAGLILARAAIDFYALTAIQPLCLAAGIFVDRSLGSFASPVRRWVWRAAACGASLYFFAWSAGPLYYGSGDTLAASEAAASAMRGAKLGPQDRIFVADRDVLVYIAAGADPPARIFHPLQMLCDFPLPGAETAMEDSLNRDPAFIVVADPAFHLDCEHSERRAMLEARLSRDYCRLGKFGGTATRGRPGAFLVYGLKKRLGSEAAWKCSVNAATSAPDAAF